MYGSLEDIDLQTLTHCMEEHKNSTRWRLGLKVILIVIMITFQSNRNRTRLHPFFE